MRQTVSYIRDLLLNRLHILPLPTQPLFPQADSIITRADRENIAAHAPADTPSNRIEG